MEDQVDSLPKRAPRSGKRKKTAMQKWIIPLVSVCGGLIFFIGFFQGLGVLPTTDQVNATGTRRALTQSAATPAATPTPVLIDVLYVVSSTDIFSCPATTCGRVGLVETGEAIGITGVETDLAGNEWYAVYYQDLTGYVAGTSLAELETDN